MTDVTNAAVPAGLRAQAREGLAGYPEWIQEVDFALPVSPQIVLTGNIRDVHPGPPGKGGFRRTTEALHEMLSINGYELVFAFDLVDQIVVLKEKREGHGAEVLTAITDNEQTPLERVSALLSYLTPTHGSAAEFEATVPAAVIIDYASRLRTEGLASAAVHALFTRVEKLTHTALPLVRSQDNTLRLFNPVIWLVDRPQDLPGWLLNSSRSRTIVIPRPSLVVRDRLAPRIIQFVSEYADLDEPSREAAGKRFAQLTDGLSIQQMRDVATLAVDRGIPAGELDRAVRALRAGVSADPWRDEGLRDNLSGARRELGEKIFGQESAILKSLDVLYRSQLGLNGSQSGESHPNRPKGVLFFAGPTGVGKTELAKQLAERVFGTEDSLVRFDMSEYGAEGSDARLIGAPPSYVGHEAGGQLTNAVRSQPFSILLFDEIEKAHFTIMRKFLQVLEDGRLTDGHGETVSFADTVIVFTSNRGVMDSEGKQVVFPSSSPEEVQESVLAAVKDFLSRELGMPELLNRIGSENIVVFDFIRKPDDERILTRDVANVVGVVKKALGVELALSDAARASLSEGLPRYIDLGGRGIANLVQDRLVNPLSRALFHHPPVAGTSVTVGTITPGDEGWVATVAHS